MGITPEPPPHERPIRPEPEEFSGITTAPDDPRHIEQVIDHIAHLNEEQREQIRAALAPDPEYACGAAYCDDPACMTHNPNHPLHESQ